MITDHINTENHAINCDEATISSAVSLTGQHDGSGRSSRSDRKVKVSSIETRDLAAEPHLRKLTALGVDVSRRAEVSLEKPALATETSLKLLVSYGRFS